MRSNDLLRIPQIKCGRLGEDPGLQTSRSGDFPFLSAACKSYACSNQSWNLPRFSPSGLSVWFGSHSKISFALWSESSVMLCSVTAPFLSSCPSDAWGHNNMMLHQFDMIALVYLRRHCSKDNANSILRISGYLNQRLNGFSDKALF